MTLCFYETLTLFAFAWWLPRRANETASEARAESPVGMLYLMALAMGLAVLAKGPVGALLPGVSMLVFMMLERRWRQIVAMLDPGAIILGAFVGASWYLACYLGGRFGFLNRQLGDENVGRFFGSLGAMSPLYYLKPILLNSAPLSMLAPIAAGTALMTYRRTHQPSGESMLRDPERARSAVRLFAIFYFVTIVFFSIAAYKRRSYLLPVWPASAVLLGWWIVTVPPIRWRRAAIAGFAGICGALVVFNFIYIPKVEMLSCRDDSYRPAAAEIARVVGPDEPLYLYGFNEEVAPLLFYLARDAPVIQGRLGDAPPGYVIVPAGVWKRSKGEALDWEPVLTSDHGNRHLVVLKRGKAYAKK
jgi:4-amino-4-deoxy-L-arabinose transferase-like glycosyltransferase